MIKRMVHSLMVVGLSICGCGRNDDGAPPSAAEMPNQQLEDFTFVETELGKPCWKLRARKLSDYRERELLQVQNVLVDFFEMDEDSIFLSSTLRADSGELRKTSGDMRVWGDVLVTTEDSTALSTGWLSWNKTAELIFTTDSVAIVRDGDVMRGVGLESDPALEDVRILSNVSGSVLGDS